MQRFSQSCLWAICLSILCTSTLFAQPKPQPVQRWEYKYAYICSDNSSEAAATIKLNELGDEGWELISISKDNSCYAHLKRLKPANAPKFVSPEERLKPTTSVPTCALTTAQAPTIRGLRLGMTVEELIELFPGANPNELKLRRERATGYPSFGQFSFTFDGAKHKDRLDNHSFEIILFDNQVQSFRVQYPFNNAVPSGRIYSDEQMIEKLAESFHLPPQESWRSAYSGHASLRCQGFKLDADSQSGISIYVEDISPAIAEKIKQRQQEDAAKKRANFKP